MTTSLYYGVVIPRMIWVQWISKSIDPADGVLAATAPLGLTGSALLDLVVVIGAVRPQQFYPVDLARMRRIWPGNRVLDASCRLAAARDRAGMVVEREALKPEAAPERLAVEDRVRHQECLVNFSDRTRNSQAAGARSAAETGGLPRLVAATSA